MPRISVGCGIPSTIHSALAMSKSVIRALLVIFVVSVNRTSSWAPWKNDVVRGKIDTPCFSGSFHYLSGRRMPTGKVVFRRRESDAEGDLCYLVAYFSLHRPLRNSSSTETAQPKQSPKEMAEGARCKVQKNRSPLAAKEEAQNHVGHTAECVTLSVCATLRADVASYWFGLTCTVLIVLASIPYYFRHVEFPKKILL